jgi:putative proteasome-type protease
MTYCVGILAQEGLVMIADTRTNAGVDNIATFRKLHLFEIPGERVVTLATATCQSANPSCPCSWMGWSIRRPERSRPS